MSNLSFWRYSCPKHMPFGRSSHSITSRCYCSSQVSLYSDCTFRSRADLCKHSDFYPGHFHCLLVLTQWRPLGSFPAPQSALPLHPSEEHHEQMWLLCPRIQGTGLICPCRYDGLTQSEVDPHLDELLRLVVWLTTCGRSELKVFDSVTYPQLEGFKFHNEASGRSSCVSWGPSSSWCCALTRLHRFSPNYL